MNFIKKHKGFLFLFFFISLWLTLLLFISPERILSIIGLEMGYFFIFLSALLGIPALGSFSFYITFLTLVSTGEFNLFLLILTIVPARIFGDFLFFSLGYKGHAALNDLISRSLKSFSLWLKKKPSWVLSLVVYLYSSFAPLPQDALMVTMGLGKIKFRSIFLPILLGNVTFILLIYFVLLGYFNKFISLI